MPRKIHRIERRAGESPSPFAKTHSTQLGPRFCALFQFEVGLYFFFPLHCIEIHNTSDA